MNTTQNSTNAPQSETATVLVLRANPDPPEQKMLLE